MLRSARTSLAAAVAAAGIALGGGAARAHDTLLIPIQVETDDPAARSQEPVTFGVAIPEDSRVAEATNLVLVGARWTQFRIADRWPNGRARWVVVDALVDVAGGRLRGAAYLASGQARALPGLATESMIDGGRLEENGPVRATVVTAAGRRHHYRGKDRPFERLGENGLRARPSDADWNRKTGAIPVTRDPRMLQYRLTGDEAIGDELRAAAAAARREGGSLEALVDAYLLTGAEADRDAARRAFRAAGARQAVEAIAAFLASGAAGEDDADIARDALERAGRADLLASCDRPPPLPATPLRPAPGPRPAPGADPTAIDHSLPALWYDLPVAVRDEGRGAFTLAWLAPEAARRIRIKVDGANVSGEPAPAAPGERQTFTIRGLDPSLAWRFTARYQTEDPTSPARSRKIPPPRRPGSGAFLAVLAGILALGRTLRGRAARFGPVALAVALALPASGCPSSSPATSAPASARAFAVAHRPSPDPIPLNEFFDLAIAVTDAATGAPARDVTVAVDADMPDHAHGMGFAPEVTSLGEGRFAARGFLFHMAGRWEVTIDVRRGTAVERTRFAADVVPPSERLTDVERARILELSPLPPLPADPSNEVADRADAAHLGRFLFFDARLSGNGAVSCATCHDPARAFTVDTPLAKGIEATERNPPSLLHTAWSRWWFWDGRADTLWSQALDPIEAHAEMGGSRAALARLFRTDPDLRDAYAAVFGAPPPASDDDRAGVDRLFANVGKAIAAFERTIVAGPAPLDRFVEGLRTGDRDKLAALGPAATRGLSVFVGKGRCTLCHSGPLLSDREFHNIGLDLGVRAAPDPGRFAGIEALKANPLAGRDEKVRLVRQRAVNLGEFKTPSLRNVADTAPYMHDGRFGSLEEVVGYYALLDQDAAIGHREETLQPLRLSTQEALDLVAFLRTLSGRVEDPNITTKPPRPRP